ncbi:DMT family transporter [Campylobacter sp.]|uniref:DMT family transporter n=1 Tax=Campylobacter sp. TaxID=205 RepID=UPI0026FDA0EB|nr:DMT family transporter [Campylobacter sp.]
MKKKLKEFGADLALVSVAIVWGVTFLPMAESLKTNGVFVILFWRFLISAVLMSLISLKFVKKIDRNSVKFGVVLGVFLFGGFVLQTFALKYAFSSTVAFITGLNVVFVPFIVFLFFRQRVYIYSFIGAFLSAGGLYLLSDSELGFGKGEILSVLCAAVYSLHIIFTGVFVRKCELYVMVCTQFFVVTLLCMFAAIIFETHTFLPVLDAAFLKAVIITSVFGTVFAFFVQSAMQRYTTPMKTALIFTFEPVSAGLFGYFVGGEILSSLQIFGACLILFGIIISEVGSYYKSQKA